MPTGHGSTPDTDRERGLPDTPAIPAPPAPERARPAPMTSDIIIPAKDPRELIELVRFWREMDAQMRQLRDTTSVPRSAITLPDEFDDIVAMIWARIEDQAGAALSAGERFVEVTLPRSETLVALIRWSQERIELLEGLTRAGVVRPEWQRPLTLMLEFWQATTRQIDP